MQKNAQLYFSRWTALILVTLCAIFILLPANNALAAKASSIPLEITKPTNGKRLYSPLLNIKGTTANKARLKVFVNGKRKPKKRSFHAKKDGSFNIPIQLLGHGEEIFKIKVVAKKGKRKASESFQVTLAKSFLAKEKTIRLVGECVSADNMYGSHYVMAHKNDSPNIQPKYIVKARMQERMRGYVMPIGAIMRTTPYDHAPFKKVSADNTFTKYFIENIEYDISVHAPGLHGTRHIDNINNFDVIDIYTYCAER